MTLHIAPQEDRDRWALEQRMLNHWFGKNTRLYMEYNRKYPTGEAMLINLKRDRPKFYNWLKARAESEMIYLGRTPTGGGVDENIRV